MKCKTLQEELNAYLDGELPQEMRKSIEEHLAQCKIPVVAEGVRAKWQPTASDLQNCENLGRKIAGAI